MRTLTLGGRGRSYAALAAAALVAPVAISGPAFAQDLQADEGAKTYIVQLTGAPLASYEGGVKGIPATTPKAGEKIDVASSAAEGYTSYLGDQQSAVLSSVGADQGDLVAEYNVALNGFAAKLTAVQAAQLRKSDQVLNVWEDEIYQLDTVSTPDYLGLTGDAGVWNQQFGGPADAGDGVVIGSLDSGVDPSNPSFAALDRPADPDYSGPCDTGGDAEFSCNTKVIGARYYAEEFGNTVVPEEYSSPRDADGHGSHTASTAAGNFGVPMSINGTDLGNGSGMAPAAQIATYKVCWAPGTGYDGGCAGAGLVQAIDDATKDGVDVINYSISGSLEYVVDPVELSFLGAADAGVFVAASAGNSGDTVGESSVAHNSPWITTVAASTHDRGANKVVTLGDGSTPDGVGVGDAVAESPLVNGADVGLPGVDPQAAAECWLDADDDASNGQQPTLDPAKVTGTIVICDRGTVARTDKSAAVDEAGGVGMILANTSAAQSLNADFHSVPTIHVDAAAGTAIHAYEAATADATAAISAQDESAVVAPEMAGFSSYGPALAGGGDLLKPDITAPGVDVIAAYHEDPETGEPTFDSLSGTSMSSPHIAGLGALLKQKYPDWSPMAIKSAMQTTARQTNTAGEPIQRSGEPADALDYGSGEVVPAPSYNPGLVYDSDVNDWLTYGCGIQQIQLVTSEGFCDGVDTDPSDFNSANIAIGELAGEQTVTRTVTDVTGAGGTYTAEVEAPAGMDVTVSPSTISVPANGEATFEVTITQVDAPLDTYAFGSLTLVSGSTQVRSAIAVQPVALAAPDEIVDEGASGTRDYEVTPGFTGQISMDIDGLVPSDVMDVVVPKDPTTTNDAIVRVDVPAGTKVVRFATYDEEVDADDIDLTVFDPDGQFAGSSGTGGSSESVTIEDPVAGSWYVTFDLFSDEASANVPLHTFAVGEADAGNMTVEPNPLDATSAQTETLTLAWEGLESGSRYIGAVNYVSGGEEVDTTLVSINAVGVDRIGGVDRYDTAAQIAAEYPEGVERVYIANGLAFADALSAAAPAAGSLAPAPMETVGGMPAPVLLTRPDALPDYTIEALQSLEPSQIVVLGGTAAISDDVEAELQDYADEVERVGGATRYDTSAMLAELYPAGADTVYVSAGPNEHIADALSGGALAGRDGAPVLLTRQDRIDPATQRALDYLDADNVVVLGGEAAVPADIYDAVGGTDRLAGATRYETAVAVLQQYEADQEGAYVASGAVFADALTGSALAGYLGEPLVLSKPTDVPDVVMAELDRVSPAYVGLLGGLEALNQDVEDELNAAYPSWVD